MIWPRVGASTGTAMKAVITIDITSAMRRPEVRSRAIATAITRQAAAAAPWKKRATRSSE